MNTLSIIDAIANKQYNAAEEGMSSLLQSKVGAALIARKEEVAEAYGDTLGEQSDYDTFFKKAMKKFGIESPADLKARMKKSTRRKKTMMMTRTKKKNLRKMKKLTRILNVGDSTWECLMPPATLV